ncbi:ABC transporter ATP-binding protein [Treponema sp.]|uniref:ABC transporter ATP-binding protein n=1 Tax=Treponema sp. TaxID=166 RepID=UPI0025DCFB28|nr:ABC transporter ATP-binding protein [Treponema sp.]MBR4321901.1 ABC transporter ATP-binding protein [Treponema sp.]
MNVDNNSPLNRFIPGKKSLTITISELPQAWDFISEKLSDYSIPEKRKTLCSLLFEEISLHLKESISAATPVTVKINKCFSQVSIKILTSSEKELVLKSHITPSNSKEELEREIRDVLIEKNSDKISTTYKNKNLSITIKVGKSRAKNTEEIIEQFYTSRKDNPPTPTEQIAFLIKIHKWGFLLSFIIRSIKTLPLVIFPVVTANIIDIVSTKGIKESQFEFWMNILVAFISLLVNILFAWFDCLVFRNIVRRIEMSLRSAMISKLQMLSISFHTNSQAGAITNKLMVNVENVASIFLSFIGNLFLVVFYVIAATVMTLRDCPVMSIFYLLFIPAAVFLSHFFKKPIKSYNKDYRLDVEEASAAITEMLGMIQISRAHGLQKKENERMDNYFNKIYGTGKNLDVVNQVFGATSWVILQLFQLLCLAFSAYLATKSIITVGMIALFQSYFTSIVNRVTTVVNSIPALTQGMEGCVSIAEVLCADSTEHNGKKDISQFKGHIELKNIDFRYKAEEANIISNFSLDIPEKSSIAFVGDSGSGKSTLINMIIGFIMPQKGMVSIDGNNLFDINLAGFRKHIAVVPQHTILFSGTLYENLTYGMPYITTERLHNLISAVGLDDLIEKLPGGLYAEISESGANLSGGEKQRLALVRALLREPKIIILDEATSALDSENEQRVTELINKVLGTCTVIMIAHRLSTIKNVDNIVVLEDGAIKEQGSFDELIAKKGDFYRRWNAQQ